MHVDVFLSSKQNAKDKMQEDENWLHKLRPDSLVLL